MTQINPVSTFSPTNFMDAASTSHVPLNNVDQTISNLASNIIKTANETTANTMIEPLKKQYDIIDKQLKDLALEIEANNKKIEALNTLRQHLSNQANGLDATQDSQMQDLVNKCREYGLLIKKDPTDFKFSKEDVEVMQRNLPLVVDKFISIDKTKTLYITEKTNQKTLLCELISAILKRDHEDQMAIARNLRG
jgi:septal ring factor EnvC (AmiA/AmiB activator)